jgi:hypothetical protein
MPWIASGTPNDLLVNKVLIMNIAYQFLPLDR